ncbi:MAG: hypothetical protein Q9175_001740 [Cornicularia normoerica]
MSERYFKPSSQILQYSSASESSPCRDDRSNPSRNINGKRPQDDIREDHVEAPRKLARLDGDHSEREESQQPANPLAKSSNPKGEQDFVDGPGRIVFIDERGKSCPAICFNKLLLNTFTRIAVISREIQERDGAIKKAKLELEHIKSSNQSTGVENAERMMEEAVKAQEDAEAAIPDLIGARRRYENLTQENKWSKLLFENSRDVAQLMIEHILNSENLLNIPASKPQKQVEVNNDHLANPAPGPEKTLHHTQNSNVLGSIPAPSTTKMQSPVDTREQMTPRQLALRNCRMAAEDLDYRKGQLAYMQEQYGKAVAADRRYQQERYPERVASTTQTDVDLKILQKAQRATRRVLEAEEAYDGAEQHAEALGVGDILADPDACYWGEVYNEFSPHTPESPSIFPVDRLRIETWMASIPESTTVDPQRHKDAESVEVDGWEATSVEIFESVSLVACDMYRKKIDRWQDLSRRSRESQGERQTPGVMRRNPRRRCRGRPSPREGRSLDGMETQGESY